MTPVEEVKEIKTFDNDDIVRPKIEDLNLNFDGLDERLMDEIK